MKSMPGLPKLVQDLADYMELFGIEVESDDTKLKVYRSVVLPTLIRMRNLDNLPTASQKIEPLPYKLS